MARKARQPIGKVWMRIGDNADYHDFGSMFEAGSELGGLLDMASPDGLTKVPVIRKSHRFGLDVEPSFINYNYISLFWGDDDARPLKELSRCYRGAKVHNSASIVVGARTSSAFTQ